MTSLLTIRRWMAISLLSAATVATLDAQSESDRKTVEAARMTIEVPIDRATDDYQDALKAFRPYREKLINFSLFTSTAEIDLARRKLEAVKTRDTTLRNLIAGAEKSFADEMVRRKVSAPLVKMVLTMFQDEHATQLAFSEQMRVSNAEYFVAMAGLADLAAAEFGQWLRRPIPNEPTQVTLPIGFTFKSAASDTRYRALVLTVLRVYAEQSAITKRVTAVETVELPSSSMAIDLTKIKLKPGEKIEFDEVKLAHGSTVKMTIQEGPIPAK